MSTSATSKSDKPPHERLKEYINIYLASDNRGDELEARFGTKVSNPITRIDFENVIAKLKSLGFTSKDSFGNYHLNIQNQYIDPKTGRTNIGNIRTEIRGLKNIQDYCRTNSFDFEHVPEWIWFNQKMGKMVNQQRLSPIDYHDFQFRINFKEERWLRPEYDIIQTLLSKWETSKKVFRLIKRFTFTHPDFPLKVDCSIIRSSIKKGRYLIPEFRIESSNVFNNPESYEIEIEIDTGKNYRRLYEQDMLLKFKQTIKYIMAGLQQTNFPVSYTEQTAALHNYMHILHKGKWAERKVYNKDFIGPSSISLERVNIAPIDEDSKLPNIRMPYTVTEKADGIRKLLYIDKNNKIYLIDVNMKVQFTGLQINQKTLANTIIDGEHVLHDKNGKFINQYLAFDIYYKHKHDLRPLPFYSPDSSQTESRLQILDKILRDLNIQSVVGGEQLPLNIFIKKFYYSAPSEKGHGGGPDHDEVFENCKLILDKGRDGLFEYEVDGLIFTPADKGVGSDTVGKEVEPKKKTWQWSMKWKPAEFNTIDFLVTTQKMESGEDVVKNIFEDGDNMHVQKQLTQYKVLILRVGFSERMHGHLNPCEDVIQDNLPHKQKRQQKN